MIKGGLSGGLNLIRAALDHSPTSPAPKAQPGNELRMPVVVQLFTRTPFDVQAVQVTTDNIAEIAVWCNGTIHEGVKSLYIKLEIPDAKSSVRQQAFPGDWILLSDQGYRIYTERALESNFVPKTTPKVSDEIRRSAIREIVLNTIMAHDDHVNPRGNKGVNKIVDTAVDEILKAS